MRLAKSPWGRWQLTWAWLAGWLIGISVGHADLALSVRQSATGTVTLDWPDLGTNFAYRVETATNLSGAAWSPAPATQWPVRANQWQDTNAPAPAMRFYRLVAIPVTAAARGDLISATLISEQSQTDINTAFTLLGTGVKAQTGARVYKILYRTVDTQGALTIASGALMVPDTISQALPLISCQHGTVTLKSDVPSNLNQEALLGLAFAATGYAATMPDYLGLGDSAGLHPYHHAATEAGTVIDLLRAARVFCATNDVPLNGQLFLAGYSQGGHSTMAAFKELEQNYTNEFTVTAAAPMAGAYDLSGTMVNDFLSDRVMPSPYYIAYLMMAYREAYAWTNALDTVLLPKYATQLPGYFDGYHSGGQIDSLVPSQPKKMFQPVFVDSIRTNAANEFRVALAANDVYQWTPKAPTRLYHCLGDRDVPFANSQVALDYFHSHGAPQVKLIDPNPALDHSGGAMPCLLSAKAWFDSLKQ